MKQIFKVSVPSTLCLLEEDMRLGHGGIVDHSIYQYQIKKKLKKLKKKEKSSWDSQDELKIKCCVIYVNITVRPRSDDMIRPKQVTNMKLVHSTCSLDDTTAIHRLLVNYLISYSKEKHAAETKSS